MHEPSSDPFQLSMEQLAIDLLRAFRGRRSQAAFSRRLGYRSNAVRTWEAGRRFPTAAKALWAAGQAGLDVPQQLVAFLPGPPPWWGQPRVDTPEGVAHLLRELAGGQRVVDLATRTGCSRYAISRWLSGQAQPRLPDFLRLVEGASLRLLDFIACLVDPGGLPSAEAAWRALERSRAVAVERPHSHAVLRVLELESYRALPRHETGFIARQLGIGLDEEVECLRLLEEGGQVRQVGGRYEHGRALTVDTRGNPNAGRRLTRYWAQVGVERIDADAPGLFSYNLFTVSERDLERLRALHLAYYRQLRAIVAESEPAERVVVANVQLFPLDRPPPVDG